MSKTHFIRTLHNSKRQADVTYSPGASSDGLVVALCLVPEGDIVHAALGGGAGTEGTQYDIHHTLRGQHVAPDNRCVFRGVQETTLGDSHLDRVQAALQA